MALAVAAGHRVPAMANDEPTDPPDDFILGWRLSRKVFEKPEHVPDVLKRLGPQRPSTLRKFVQALDGMATDYCAARNKRLPKFEEANPILERFEKLLIKGREQWNDELRPLHPTFIAQRIKMIPSSERKEKADAAMATIAFGTVATTLLRILRNLRDPKEYAAAHLQPRGKSLERVFLWEPLLQLLKDDGVKPGQHGSFLVA